MLDPNLLPVGLELVRDDHRQRGVDALTHLGAMHQDGHDAGRVDADPEVGRERGITLGEVRDGQRVAARVGSRTPNRQPHAQHEEGTGRC